MRYRRPVDSTRLTDMNSYLLTFALGTASGIGLSAWSCSQINRFRGPRYYRRRARRVAHGYAR
jgi:hypothetical protein